MKKLLAVVVSFVALVGCGSSPEEDCKRSAEASCERMYTCDSSVKFGDSQADCAADVETLCLAALQQRDGKPCEEGKEYDSGKAQECIDATKSQSCEAYNAGTEIPACEQVCK